MWLLLLVQEKAATIVEPALTTLDKYVIGSLLIISWALAILAIHQLIRVQNARVADQQAMNERSETLMKKMITTFTEMKGALEGLRKAEEDSQKLNEAIKDSLARMGSRIDMLVFTVGGKRFTPPSPIVRSKTGDKE